MIDEGTAFADPNAAPDDTTGDDTTGDDTTGDDTTGDATTGDATTGDDTTGDDTTGDNTTGDDTTSDNRFLEEEDTTIDDTTTDTPPPTGDITSPRALLGAPTLMRDFCEIEEGATTHTCENTYSALTEGKEYKWFSIHSDNNPMTDNALWTDIASGSGKIAHPAPVEEKDDAGISMNASFLSLLVTFVMIMLFK